MRTIGSSIRNLAAGAAALACLSAPAAAEEFDWSVSLTGTSDWIFRGLSYTNEAPAFQPNLHMTYGILYGGLWASNIDGGSLYDPFELDFYGGITPKLAGIDFDFGVVWYTYPAANSGGSMGGSYVEFKAGASFSPFSKFTVKPVFWYTPDQEYYAETYTIESTFAYELPALGIFTPTVSALVGYTEESGTGLWVANDDNYTYWNAGIALAVEKFTFDFRYWDTNLPENANNVYNGISDERFVFTTTVALP